MELSAEASEKGTHHVEQKILRPGLEGTPMIFGMLPENLDQVEFRVVGGQIHRHKAMQQQPTVQDRLIDMVMHRGLVHDQNCLFIRRGGLGQAIKKGKDVLAPDRMVTGLEMRMVTGLEMQMAAGIVKRPHYIGPFAAETGVCRVRLRQRRPASLHIRQAGEPRLIEVKQFNLVVAGSLFHQAQGILQALELCFVTFFLRESRVRLKDSPRFFSPIESRNGVA